MHALARRSTELGLVIMAGLITAAAYVLASLGKNSAIPTIIVPFLIALLGLLLLAHIATRFLARGADATLLPLAAMLHGIGYVMITRLNERLAGLQTTWTFVAIAAYILTLLFVQAARPRPLQMDLLHPRRWVVTGAAGARDRQHVATERGCG